VGSLTSHNPIGLQDLNSFLLRSLISGYFKALRFYTLEPLSFLLITLDDGLERLKHVGFSVTQSSSLSECSIEVLRTSILAKYFV
jgi:hypothetical protein